MLDLKSQKHTLNNGCTSSSCYIIITGQVLDVLRVGQDVSPNNSKSGVSISGHTVYMYVGTSDSKLSDRNYSVVRPRAQR